MWNFKGTLWNSTQNILLICWKIWFLYNIEFLRALRLKSSYTFLKRPPDLIPRLSKNEMAETISDPVQVQQHYGPKRPDMPAPHTINDEEFSDLVQGQGVSVARAHELDLEILKSIVTSDKVPEYGDHTTSVSREQNHTMKPATDTRYRPLIDIAPCDPSTIKRVLLEAQALTASCGQPFLVILLISNYIEWLWSVVQ